MRCRQLLSLGLVQALQTYANFPGALNDVSVGNDQSVGRQHHARTDAALGFKIGRVGLVVVAAQAKAGRQHLHYRLRDLAGELLNRLAEDMQRIALKQFGRLGGTRRLLGLRRAQGRHHNCRENYQRKQTHTYRHSYLSPGRRRTPGHGRTPGRGRDHSMTPLGKLVRRSAATLLNLHFIRWSSRLRSIAVPFLSTAYPRVLPGETNPGRNRLAPVLHWRLACEMVIDHKSFADPPAILKASITT